MTLVHFLVDLGVAGVLTALLARVVELTDRGSSDDGPSDGGGGGGGGGRPRRPLDRTRPVPVIAATLLRRALTTGRGQPESASTDQRLLRSLTARSI